MADELQALLDKISEEELKKADMEKERILSQARSEAAEIIRQAKAAAQKTMSDAEKAAEVQRMKGIESLKQASRDVLIDLEKQLKQRVQAAAEALVKASLDPQATAAIISRLVTEFAARGGDTDELKVLLSADEIAEVEASLKAALAENLRSNVALAPSNAVQGGFKLRFENSSVTYDFTVQSLADTLAAGLGPKLASIITA